MAVLPEAGDPLLHLAVFGVGLYWSLNRGIGQAPWIAASPLLILVGLYLMVTHRSRQQYRRSRTLRSPLRYTLTDGGVELAAPHGRTFLEWGRITGFQDTPSFFLIYGSRGEAFAVGKAWFGDPDEARAFLREVEARVAGPARASGAS